MVRTMPRWNSERGGDEREREALRRRPPAARAPPAAACPTATAAQSAGRSGQRHGQRRAGDGVVAQRVVVDVLGREPVRPREAQLGQQGEEVAQREQELDERERPAVLRRTARRARTPAARTSRTNKPERGDGQPAERRVRQAGQDLLERREVVQQQRGDEAAQRGTDAEQREEQRAVEHPEQGPLGPGRQAQPEAQRQRGDRPAPRTRAASARGRAGRAATAGSTAPARRARHGSPTRTTGAPARTRCAPRAAPARQFTGPAGVGGHSARTVHAGASSLSWIMLHGPARGPARRRTYGASGNSGSRLSISQ